MSLYKYITPGQGLTTPWGQNFDVNRNILWLWLFGSKNLFEVWFIHFFHGFIHVYSPRAGADSTQRTKSWCQQKCLVTSFICCKFKKKCLWSLILYNFLHDLIHVYSPGAGAESPQGIKFWCQQQGLITLPICCKSQKNFFQVWFYTIIFHDLIHVYSPAIGAYSPQGTKFWCQQKLIVTSVISCQFQIIDDNSFWKIHSFTFFPYKSIRDQIWPCRKISLGQPRVIIWANLVVLKHPMMHTKIQGHRPFSSGEEDVFWGFYHIWPWRPFWSCDQDQLGKLSFPYPIEARYEVWILLAPWFLRRRCLKSVDDDGRRWTTTYDGRRTTDDGGLPIL